VTKIEVHAVPALMVLRKYNKEYQAHACNPRYLVGRAQEDSRLRPAQAKK
jgi:hypothetical protein